jgi:regulator of telomere elongation helicase 1
LCLLCSSLAWLIDQKSKFQYERQQEVKIHPQSRNSKNEATNNFNKALEMALEEMQARGESAEAARWKAPTIIYTSRTHSQLTQAMKELKNSSYKDQVTSVALGSRDQLCINSEVLTEGKTSTERNNLCQIKINKRACSFRERIEKVTSRKEVIENNIKDIEDLVTIGTKCKACPYYLSRDLAANADIIFMPYNYLLDAKILKSFKINLDGAVVILDEAHNVEQVCLDAASINFASSDITNCINDITHIMKILEKDDELLMVTDEETQKDFTIDDLAKLKEIMLEFESTIDGIESVFHKSGKTFPGGKFFELLESAGINHVTYPMIRQLVDSLTLFLTQSSAGSLFGRKGGGLMKIQEVIDTAFQGLGQNSIDTYKRDMEKGYRLHVEIEPEKKKENTAGMWLSNQTKLSKSPKVINYWCFDPGYGMANVIARNVRSIILTSGTLAPLKPLISELALKVEQRLENPHIIKNSQVAVRVVSNGPDKELLDGSFKNRDNQQYIKSMGLTIQGISRITPHGVLVFFSSYSLMEKCHEKWESCGIWKDLSDIKPIFKEPRNKEEFLISIKSYYETVSIRKGAIYMAVLRGKVSEGLDFNDNNARAVIICGIPFPPYMDPRVVLKKSYLDLNRNKENELQTGSEWYILEAVRAVNQAIGRVIRHKDDYGAILLCDSRFHNYKTQLSKWIQPHLQAQNRNDTNFGKIIGELARFFRNAEGTCPKPKMREIDVNEIKQEIDGNESVVSATIDGKSLVKQQIKLENSHNIYQSTAVKQESSEDREEREKYFEKMRAKSSTTVGNSLMNALNHDVTTIDFNTSKASTSNNKFKIPLPSHAEGNASKKPRLVMIANANVIPGEKILAEAMDTKEKILFSVKREFWQKSIPEDKGEFLSSVS